MTTREDDHVGGRRDLVLRDVVRRTPDGRVVLDTVSAVFRAGSVTAVLGTNGAGKSMLARVLAGVDRPDRGRVERPVRGTFLLHERAPVLPGCSARTLAAALAPAVGRNRPDWPRRLDDALRRLGSTHPARAPLRSLSKGNLQKAHLAVAYAVRPVVAVLDEPMTGLDLTATPTAGEMITALADGGSVVVITAHHALPGSDRLLRLQHGHLAPHDQRTGRAFLVELAPVHAALEQLDRGRLGQVELVAGSAAARRGRVRLRVAESALPTLLRAAVDEQLMVESVAEESR